MTSTDEMEFDFSQLDDTLINDQQKQNLIDYVNQIQSQKRALHDELNNFKLSTGPLKRRRTKRSMLSNSVSLPVVNRLSHHNLQTMVETLIYIVQEMNLEQVKLTTAINQITERVHQNEAYLNQLNSNIEILYEQMRMKPYGEYEIEPIVLPESSSSMSDENGQEPIDLSSTSQYFQSRFNLTDTLSRTSEKSSTNKEYIELGDPTIGLSCPVLKRKYDQVRRRTELAYIHGEKRAIGRLLTFLIRQFFTNDELRNASLDGRVRNTQALAEDRMSIIDKHLQSIFGVDYNLYRVTKDCAEQVNVVCRHARNPKHMLDSQMHSDRNQTIKQEQEQEQEQEQIDDRPLDDYESFQEQLFIQANDQRFHELAQEYDQVHQEVLKQREIENQLRHENEDLKTKFNSLEEQLKTVQSNEKQLESKWQTTSDQVRQLTHERDRLRSQVDEKEKENYELKKQRESLQEENNRVHETNSATITRLQELESTSNQLQSFEALWSKERQLYIDQLQTLEQSLIDTKKTSTDQQTQIMQLKIQLQAAEGQLQAQNRSLDMGIEEKNGTILNLDRQLREKNQLAEQLQFNLQRTIRQAENQQTANEKTIQSLKNQIEELTKKNSTLNEKYEEQQQILTKTSTERDVIRNEMKAVTEMFEKQTIENEQTIRRLQDELDNTTQLLESIRSKGADLSQLTNFLDGTLSHIRSNDPSLNTSTISTTSCSECRQLKSALVLELTGKERFRFGYEQLSSMIKEAAPILRRQKQDYEASFEVIAKLTSELNEARKELTELQHMSGESIENYRFIQRENQILLNDNKSLATKIQVLLAEIEELRTGNRPTERAFASDNDPNQQVPLTFRNVVELQHVNQKLDKMLRELREQTNSVDEDLNRTRFDQLKKDHQEQQEKLRETRNQLESLQTQLNSLIQERDFLRLLVSRSSSTQSTSSTGSVSADTHQLENLRDQLHRLQEKYDQLTKKTEQTIDEKEGLLRASNERIRSLQYELLTTRTEVEQTNEKLRLIDDEAANNRLTIASLRTEINGWQERHSTLVQIRNKQEQQYFNVLTELRQLKDEKNSLECRLNTLESERKFDAIKYEQIENECLLLKNEIVKNEQIQPVIEKLQNLAEFTKEKTKAMFEVKINDLTVENEQFRQRFEQIERERELTDRSHQSRIDEFTQNLQQEKTNHAETRTKYLAEKEKADEIQRRLTDLENKLQSNSSQKTDFEQQLGDYEKELKMLRVKLDAANRELELKQTLVQSGIENVSQLAQNEQKAMEQLRNIHEEFGQKSSNYESQIERLKQDIIAQQSLIEQHQQTIDALNESLRLSNEQHQAELDQSNEHYQQLLEEKTRLDEKIQEIDKIIEENQQITEKLVQLQSRVDEQKTSLDQFEIRENQFKDEIMMFQTEQQKLLNDIQQCERTIEGKDQFIQSQQQLIEQAQQRYQQLEEKHKEQHETMLKLSTHLAARESELLSTTTDDTSVNESWNAILKMNNYLRVENTHLTEEVERIRLENAHIKEQNQHLEDNFRSNQTSIEDLKAENQNLQDLKNRFERDQQEIQQLKDKCQSYEHEKRLSQEETQRFQTNIDQLNQEKQVLKDQLQSANEKRVDHEKELVQKTNELVQQNQANVAANALISKLESETQELKQTNNKLKTIANKYRRAAGNTAPGNTSTNLIDTDVLPVGTLETPADLPADTDANRNRNSFMELNEKMSKLKNTLVIARNTLATQKDRAVKLTAELTHAKQSRISNDLTECHAMIESIRQAYQEDLDDYKRIIQLFDDSNNDEQMSEILRLRKRLDDLLANKATTTATTTSTTSKSSEDAVPKTIRVQSSEPVISRVAPMAPASGRQIGVATPMTASSTSITNASLSWGTASNTETISTQSSVSVDHSASSSSASQLMTPAAVNLLMKRARTDDGDRGSSETTLKRTKPETETAPLIAHVEPHVREPQQTTFQEAQPTIETNVFNPSRSEISTTSIESEISSVVGRDTISSGQPVETDSRAAISSASTTTPAVNQPTNDLTASTSITPIEPPPTSTATEQAGDTRRGDIAPIVYDVRNIPTITSGPSSISIRGGAGRTRPLMNIPANRRPWLGRGMGSGRGGLGGRGTGGPGGPGT